MSEVIVHNKKKVLRPEKRKYQDPEDSSSSYSFRLDPEHFLSLFDEDNLRNIIQTSRGKSLMFDSDGLEDKDASLRDEILHAQPEEVIDEAKEEIKKREDEFKQTQTVSTQKPLVDGVKKVVPNARIQELSEEGTIKSVHRPLHAQQPKQMTKKNFLDRMTAFIDKDLEK